jgi:hypothetical protein
MLQLALLPSIEEVKVELSVPVGELVLAPLVVGDTDKELNLRKATRVGLRTLSRHLSVQSVSHVILVIICIAEFTVPARGHRC